jgi:hypothetical protein
MTYFVFDGITDNCGRLLCEMLRQGLWCLNKCRIQSENRCLVLRVCEDTGSDIVSTYLDHAIRINLLKQPSSSILRQHLDQRTK